MDNFLVKYNSRTGVINAFDSLDLIVSECKCKTFSRSLLIAGSHPVICGTLLNFEGN